MPHILNIFLWDLRVKERELLKEMADKLGLSSAELSAIEHGKKPMPKGFLDRIQTLYFDKSELIKEE
ncbi:putative transcriptional regulator [Bacillus sp. TS-2]|nr:putative transcriptional regulator [Bacillus sp. TS-2]